LDAISELVVNPKLPNALCGKTAFATDPTALVTNPFNNPPVPRLNPPKAGIL
jgi:hypothetical protein